MKTHKLLLPKFLVACTFTFAQIPVEDQDNIKQRVDTEKHVGIVVGFLKDGEEAYFSYGKTML